ncbi:hypothetical protein HGM15179_012849 [Zosterops borbonicus]|uniref:Methyltransferase like 15 n=1 Tax=Zosterops borbonicus TaxID=364589 RepID=A0A8K1LHQ3_9PASS|nr:hypothetical protein HGM15179_012849 [Zosterops borbonicus]
MQKDSTCQSHETLVTWLLQCWDIATQNMKVDGGETTGIDREIGKRTETLSLWRPVSHLWKGSERTSRNLKRTPGNLEKCPLPHQYRPESANGRRHPLLEREGTHQERFLDMTFGAGGHTTALLEKASGITVYALDRDPTAYKIAQQLSEAYPKDELCIAVDITYYDLIVKEVT